MRGHGQPIVAAERPARDTASADQPASRSRDTPEPDRADIPGPAETRDRKPTPTTSVPKAPAPSRTAPRRATGPLRRAAAAQTQNPAPSASRTPNRWRESLTRHQIAGQAPRTVVQNPLMPGGRRRLTGTGGTPCTRSSSTATGQATTSAPQR
jgi:hypothetical protein